MDSIVAFNIVTRVDDFTFTPEQIIAQAMTTFIAQNKSANKYERIKKGFKIGMLFEVEYWIFIGIIAFFLHKQIISLFIENIDITVISIASRYLILMSLFYLWSGITNGIQGFFRSIGYFKITILATFIQESIRTIISY